MEFFTATYKWWAPHCTFHTHIPTFPNNWASKGRSLEQERRTSRCDFRRWRSTLAIDSGMSSALVVELSHNELENHHFYGKIHYFDWAIFNSYVDITRGYIPGEKSGITRVDPLKKTRARTYLGFVGWATRIGPLDSHGGFRQVMGIPPDPKRIPITRKVIEPYDEWESTMT